MARLTRTREGIKLNDKVFFFLSIKGEYLLVQGKVTYIAKRDEELTLEFDPPEGADRFYRDGKTKRYIAHKTEEDAIKYKLNYIKRRLLRIEEERKSLDKEEARLHAEHEKFYRMIDREV